MSRSYSRGKITKGGIVRVNLPKFNFQHLQRQSDFVQEVLQTQVYSQEIDARQLTRSIISQKKPEEVEEIQKQTLIHYNELRDKLQSAGGIFQKRVVLKSQKSIMNRSQYSKNARNSQDSRESQMNTLEYRNSVDQYKIIQGQSKSYLFNETQQFRNGSNLEWIDKLNSKKGMSLGVSKAVRNPIKVENFLMKNQERNAQQNLNNQSQESQHTMVSYYKQRDIQTVQQQHRNIRKEQQNILSEDIVVRTRGNQSMYNYSDDHANQQSDNYDDDFGQQGLNTNKTLKNYDCFQEIKSPQELVEQFKNDPEYHAKCPHYSKDKKYIWSPVQVIQYEEEDQKYLVRVIENNSFKYVQRLSLMFKSENENDFRSRLQLCKILQKQAEDEIRFYKYVDKLGDDMVTILPEWQQSRIMECVEKQKSRKANKRRTNISQVQDYQKNQKIQRLKDELMEQIKYEYKLFMKKYLVMKEMENNQNFDKFKQFRIKHRYVKDYLMKYTKKRTLVLENFIQVSNIIREVPYLSKPSVGESLLNVTEKAGRKEIFRIFSVQFSQGQLPLPLDIFEDQMKKNHELSRLNMMTQWRSFLMQEVQDILRNVYSFYLTDKVQYEQSELQRLLKKLDFMFRTYTEENILEYNIGLWVNFIQRFNPPRNDLNDPWKMWQQPILYLNLSVNLNVRKKKTQKKKGEKDPIPDQQISEEETIYFEPSEKQVKETLCRPIDFTIQTFEKLFRLEKDLVPLVDLPLLNVLELNLDNTLFVQARKDIENFITQGFQGPQKVLDDFQQFSYLFEKSQSNLLKKMFGDTKDKPNILSINMELIETTINDYQRAKHEIEKLCIDEKIFSFFQVRTKLAKQALTQKAIEILNSILSKTSDIVTENITRITASYQEMFDKMMSQPKNEIELVEVKNFIGETEVNLAKIHNEVVCVYMYLQMFEKVFYSYGEKNIENFWFLKMWPLDIREALLDGQRNTSALEQKFTEKLESEKEIFITDLLNLQVSLEEIKRFDNYKMVKECATDVLGLRDRLEKAQEKLRSFNERENLFKQPITDYEDLNKILVLFEPNHKLWDIAMEFDLDKQDWYQGPFLRLTYPPIEKKINTYYMKEILRLQKFFQDVDDERTNKVIKEYRNDVEKFREKMWIVELLTTEAMQKKPQTWKEIFRECNITDIDNNDELTFQGLLDMGVQQFREKIEEISKRADKQWSIEKKLNELVEKLKETQVEFTSYGNTGTFVLKHVDELQQLFDDQLNILLMMKASPFIKAVLNKANQIEQKIILIQDTLEGWIKTQRGWMYLEPIFSSEDIKSKLPSEKQKFDLIDKNWRFSVDYFLKEPFLWEGIDSDRFKLEFQTNNKLLDEIQKSLSDYLETKRRYFPRFFFLSDEELLEILAQTKDPLTVQKHINKCFEAISSLHFQEGKPDQDGNMQLDMVSAMISPEKEIVKFQKQINVNEGEKKGNVERWLSEIEFVMVDTLKRITLSSIQDIDTPRPDWIKKWPGQCVLAISKLRWTTLVERTIIAQNDQSAVQDHEGQTQEQVYPSLQYLEQYLSTQLMEETVKLLYSPALDDLTRIKVNSLIVLDVHSRDIVSELAIKEGLTLQSFDWLAQLRYTWVEDVKKGQIGTLHVGMVNADVTYGFEYLGNSGRLVITPLTDRCYRTLMGAYLLNYGGAPEGPAGTGKTETVKDLAKALAVQCVVFNCSDGLNYQAMSKFFKGLASSGAWCCFDEFNRIDLEVLSVIAQQVLTIQTAIKEKKRIFFFDGSEYNLVSSCSINITMNPGYAGRSELPDNLKALFRPCAMMVPDYKLISAIYLVSVGFKNATHLSVKIVACLKLSSEQLSSQDHYDFGMRALKAMLTAAGYLKRQYPDEDEDILCLRGLMDVNVPKFTQNDIPLFLSITSDLFPMVKLPSADNDTLITALKQQCQILKLQSKQSFLDKCIQLYDTINVRHGLMNVGQAFSGKSKILECLQKSITSLTGLDGFVPVQNYKLNPKSVTSDQLYGKLDPDTKSWSDGVIAIIMRECAKDLQLKEKKWIIFDGPVDAIWIENMNTVLDDNKKLCLTSGEIIKMTPQMTMMFEVADLSVASPATVSRCGMVYMEPDGLGWLVLVQSFTLTLQGTVLEKFIELIQRRLKWLIDTSFAWLKKYGGPHCFVIFNSDMTYVKNILLLLKTLTEDYLQEGIQLSKNIEDQISNSCLFSTVWGLGGSINESIRKPYNDFLQKLITAASDIQELYSLNLELPFEPQAIQVKVSDKHQSIEKFSLYDLMFDKQNNIWLPWTASQPNYIINHSTPYSELIVPTNDLIRNNFFLHLCIRSRIHLLVSGPTGTGKTINMVNEINKYYFNKDYTNLQTAFSGQTSVNQIQRTIEAKINSRRRKGYFGPEEGKKCCVIFIDDLNMPAKEKYGAQPPIELLRQWMDTSGWYDLDTKEFKHLQDIVFVSAMLPPQGGRNSVSLRYLRHYLLQYAQPFDNDSLNRIFGTVIEWFILKLGQEQIIPKSIQSISHQLVQCTVELYNKLQNTKELLPTPAKSHYVYNLRDISKVFQGISKGDMRGLRSEDDIVKLWAHECQRVFQDRLITSDDQKVFQLILDEIISVYLKRDWEQLVVVNPLMFASFIPCVYPDGDTSKRPYSDVYCQIIDLEKMKKTCEDQLSEYNSFFPQNKMSLVLFLSAMEHIIRIVRVLQTSYGHLLLVGVGGSGRKSLAQLSSFISLQNESYMVDQRQWIEELQKLLRVVGLDGKTTAFVIMDSQIIQENMLEQICNLLNNGEVPNIYPQEEKQKLIEDLSQIISSGTPQEKYQEFIKRCKNNLHIVMCMSPVGESFRQRLRTFPALVNCTTIDWFLPWPPEALQSTAEQFLRNQMELGKGLEATEYNELISGLITIAVDMQERVKNLTVRYFLELRSHYYVTPTSYLELLTTFKRLVGERILTIENSIYRYSSGVDKILSTELDVSRMKQVLQDLQPKLERATIENSHMLINLQKKQKEADGKKQICENEEKECNTKSEEANILRNDCQQELEKVLPLLAAAAEALEKITRDDMVQLKSFTSPPPAAAIVMEGVCYTFNEDQHVKWRPKEPGSLEKIQDFWEYAKRTLLNDKLIKRVKDFKEEQIRSIPQAKINKLKVFVQNPMFEREKVFNASKAAGNLALWIRAVIDTYDALLIVDPKRAQLKVAENNLREAEKVLEEKKMALEEVLGVLTKLESDYSVAKKEKEELEAEVNRCRVQLERAEKLIQGLGGEKESWKRKALEFKAGTKNIIGDCMLCSGIIAYLGAFPSAYRETAIQSWSGILETLKIPFQKDFQISRILSDPIQIGQWTNQQKLPNDSFSIDNAIILKNSSRWPLMIDPQTQANQWIKIMENYQPPLNEKDKKQQKNNQDDGGIKRRLIVLKNTTPLQDILMTLESSIQLGYSVLLEGLGEQIANVYEPILEQKMTKQGGVLRIKFGEKMLDYNSDFRFYMTTKLGRPHYSPDICVQVTMLNFQVTQEGLQDQMLNIVVKQEEPIKEEQRQKNIKDFYENKGKQKMTEDLILKLLNEAEGNLLENEFLIETLQKSKIESIEIEDKLRKQEHDREVFNTIRNLYIEVAVRVSQIYFVVLDLAMIEPTYQWSLEFYIILFERSIKEAIVGKEHRCLNIIDKFQSLLYDSVCRSLLEKDKIIFSFLLQIKILQVERNITATEIRLMMIGVSYNEPTKQKPVCKDNSWLSNKLWCGVTELTEKLISFKNFDQSFSENTDLWQLYVQNENPDLCALPTEWEQNLNSFQKLIVLRILRPDKVVAGLQRLVSTNMGPQFIDPPAFNLEASYLQSDARTPIIFILSPGADPRLEIQQLAEQFGQKNNLEQLSLGQGQGAAAERSIKRCIEEGKWVLLQNCHLAKSFMPDLERIYESVISSLQPDESFRMWLTTAPSDVFPVSLLQRGIKLTFEPPRGIRNNLLRVYLAQDSKKFEDTQKPYEFKKLLFGLAFFHSLLLERRKYGPLGWNVPYEFTQADFNISQSQLRLFLDEFQQIPWDALNYLVAETNYGGRVTDPKDRRLIKIMLQDFYDQQILLESYKFSSSGIYFAPNNLTLQENIEFIRDLPINDPTEIFGLHQNAEISSAILETDQICGTILSLLPRTTGPQGKSTEDTIKEISFQILQQLPLPYNLQEIARKYPVEYENSMNTVLQQELMRFNKLLLVIRQSMENVVKAIEGFIVMSSDLEQVGISVFDNLVPDLWQKVSYPSLKPLQSYINDLVTRLRYMQQWADTQAPVNFWISGFFFTQSFLTGVQQNHARKNHIPIDTLQLKFDFKKFDESFVSAPEDGCYIYGLFFDGARWNDEKNCIQDAEPYVLFYDVPTIQVIPVQGNYDYDNDPSFYECPVYKTSKRAGILSTTGHSTNYVLSIYTPIVEQPRYWIKRGLAMLTQLND